MFSGAVFSNVEGPDGNGIVTPSSSAAGGSTGTANTANNTPALASNGFAPPDLVGTDVSARITARVGAVGTAPTAIWHAVIDGSFIRNGNTVTRVGNPQTSNVRSSPALVGLLAEWVVDNSQTPNHIAVQVTGKNATNITWRWDAPFPGSL